MVENITQSKSDLSFGAVLFPSSLFMLHRFLTPTVFFVFGCTFFPVQAFLPTRVGWSIRPAGEESSLPPTAWFATVRSSPSLISDKVEAPHVNVTDQMLEVISPVDGSDPRLSNVSPGKRKTVAKSTTASRSRDKKSSATPKKKPVSSSSPFIGGSHDKDNENANCPTTNATKSVAPREKTRNATAASKDLSKLRNVTKMKKTQSTKTDRHEKAQQQASNVSKLSSDRTYPTKNVTVGKQTYRNGDNETNLDCQVEISTSESEKSLVRKAEKRRTKQTTRGSARKVAAQSPDNSPYLESSTDVDKKEDCLNTTQMKGQKDDSKVTASVQLTLDKTRKSAECVVKSSQNSSFLDQDNTRNEGEDLGKELTDKSVDLLSRLAVAFSPSNQRLPLHEIEQIQVLEVTRQAISIQAVVCEGGDCRTFKVPVPFPDPGNEQDDLSLCVSDNLRKLDQKAMSMMKESNAKEAAREKKLAHDRLLSIMGNPDVDLPPWWVSPDSTAFSEECTFLKGILNEDEFEDDLVTLTDHVLKMSSGPKISEPDVRVEAATVAAVGPAGLILRASVGETGVTKLEEVSVAFQTAAADTKMLRAAVLDSVSSPKTASFRHVCSTIESRDVLLSGSVEIRKNGTEQQDNDTVSLDSGLLRNETRAVKGVVSTGEASVHENTSSSLETPTTESRSDFGNHSGAAKELSPEKSCSTGNNVSDEDAKIRQLLSDSSPDMLARLVVAFNPSKQRIRLEDIEKVDVREVTHAMISIQAIVCEDGDCLTLQVPIRFQDPGQKADDLNLCVFDNLQELDKQALGIQASRNKEEETVEKKMARERLLTSLSNSREIDLPLWWILPDSGLKEECTFLTGVLNEDEFGDELVTLAEHVLTISSTTQLAPSTVLIEAATVAAVGPAGLVLRASVGKTGAARIEDVAVAFQNESSDATILRGAVLDVVSKPESALLRPPRAMPEEEAHQIFIDQVSTGSSVSVKEVDLSTTKALTGKEKVPKVKEVQ